MQTTILAFIRSADMQKGGPTCRVGRPRCKNNFCISDGQPCMSALLFYCFTISLFYFFTPGTVLPRPMFGVGRPRCKKAFHILPRTTAERSFCFSDGQPCMSALLFYCFTILLFFFSLHARDAKKRFCISDGQPCMSALLFYCFTNITIFLFCSRYSTAAANVWGWPPEMQKSFPRTTTYYSRT